MKYPGDDERESTVEPTDALADVTSLLQKHDNQTVSQETINNGIQLLAIIKKLTKGNYNPADLGTILTSFLKTKPDFKDVSVVYMGEETIATYGQIQPYADGLSDTIGKSGSNYYYNVWFERTQENTWVLKYSKINPNTGNYRS